MKRLTLILSPLAAFYGYTVGLRYLLRLFAVVVLFYLMTLVLCCGQTNGVITLAWDNTNNPPSLADASYIYHSTNVTIPLTNWTKCWSGAGTTTVATVYFPPGVHFFYATLSNMWGETFPSNVASTPAVVVGATRTRITSLSLTNGP